MITERADPPRLWSCARCTGTARTAASQPGTPMHRCGGFAGMTIPYVEHGRRAEVRMIERDDYVGEDMVQVDADGRVWAGARATRDDGEDVVVYAPCATGKAG